MWGYQDVNKKLNHTFTYGLIKFMENHTQFDFHWLNSKSYRISKNKQHDAENKACVRIIPNKFGVSHLNKKYCVLIYVRCFHLLCTVR